MKKKKYMMLVLVLLMMTWMIPSYGTAVVLPLEEDEVFYRKVEILEAYDEFLEESKVINSFYEVSPTFGSSYTPGVLNRDVLEDALANIHYYRKIAYLNNQVLLDNQYNEMAQSTALVMYSMGKLSHYPVKMPTITEALFAVGEKGAAESNLSTATYSPLPISLKSFMDDSMGSNLFLTGHRRWVLNPGMTKVGFGFVTNPDLPSTNDYSVMKVFGDGDNSYKNGLNEEMKYIAWPSEVAFPMDLFSTKIPWSVSLNTQLYDNTKTEELVVTLENLTTHTKETFYKGSKGDENHSFSVDTQGFGIPYCVIFRPSTHTYLVNEQFRVTLSGLYTKNGEKATLSYDTEFFNIEAFRATYQQSNYYYAHRLNEVGLFNGTSKGFELERKPSRIEGLVMYIRLLGKEDEALAMTKDTPVFSDVPAWANGYTLYAYKNGLTKGIGNRLFGSEMELTAKDYATFILRAKSYQDPTDFNWSNAIEKLVALGLIDASRGDYLNTSSFTRGDMATLSWITGFGH